MNGKPLRTYSASLNWLIALISSFLKLVSAQILKLLEIRVQVRTSRSSSGGPYQGRDSSDRTGFLCGRVLHGSVAFTGSTALELVSTGMSVLTSRFNDTLQLELGKLDGISGANMNIGDSPTENLWISSIIKY